MDADTIKEMIAFFFNFQQVLHFSVCICKPILRREQRKQMELTLKKGFVLKSVFYADINQSPSSCSAPVVEKWFHTERSHLEQLEQDLLDQDKKSPGYLFESRQITIVSSDLYFTKDDDKHAHQLTVPIPLYVSDKMIQKRKKRKAWFSKNAQRLADLVDDETFRKLKKL